MCLSVITGAWHPEVGKANITTIYFCYCSSPFSSLLLLLLLLLLITTVITTDIEKKENEYAYDQRKDSKHGGKKGTA